MTGKKKRKKNNVIIALNVLHAKKEKLYPAYVPKYNSKYFLMILNGKVWHYLAAKEVSALLSGII